MMLSSGLFLFFLLHCGVQAKEFRVVHKGIPGTLTHRIYLKNSEGVPISPFHDIPLKVRDGVYNMIVEIPRWTNAKYETTKEVELNPIIQDTKLYDGVRTVRYVDNIFPYHGYMWNYGAFPQTWEDPDFIDPHTGVGGDNDPVDVIEIGKHVGFVGEVKQVKVLGVLALLDKDETDWKVMVIDINDPLAPFLNDIEDVQNELPGLLAASRDFFRNYKFPQSGRYNTFGFDGKWQGRDFTENILEETHGKWKELLDRKEKGKIMTENVTNKNSPFYIKSKEAQKLVRNNPDYEPDKSPDPPASLQRVHHVTRSVSEPVCAAKDQAVCEAA